ncbi:helix-turn-helix transcriptional regulator [Pararhodobacter sp.]|uniref:helix-turn-helix domain-containing protein n=1 Tax=Pararhodobacter sp. TaxID=2127056 RepID=UPI002AFFF995|nr:helix-turn-helix transcriptional regulator [Pararhodobacter sp.]
MRDEKYGERLKTWRQAQKLSQRELSAELSVSRGYIGDIEAGRSEPSRNFLISLQEKFGVRADYILYGEGSPVAASADPAAQPANRARPDPLLLMICGGAVSAEYSSAKLKLTPDDHFNQAVWIYDTLISRMKNPADGDELEQLLPEIRRELRKKIGV